MKKIAKTQAPILQIKQFSGQLTTSHIGLSKNWPITNFLAQTQKNILQKKKYQFSTASEAPINPTFYNETLEMESAQISSILRKKKRNIINTTPLSSEELSNEISPETLNFKQKTEIDVVKIRVKQFEEVKTMKKIGGVFISKYNEMIENPEIRPSNFKYFKYGLPVPNLDPEFKSLTDISSELFPKPQTSTENLFNFLSIPEYTTLSYDNFEAKLIEKYNFEEDMYGEIIPNEKILSKMVNEFKEDIIPAEKLKNGEHMDFIRSWATIN